MTVRPRKSNRSVHPPAALAASPTSTNLPLAMRTLDTTVRLASIVWIFPLVQQEQAPGRTRLRGCRDGSESTSAQNRRVQPVLKQCVGHGTGFPL